MIPVTLLTGSGEERSAQGMESFLNLWLGFLFPQTPNALTESLLYIALKITKSKEHQDKQDIKKLPLFYFP